MAIDSSKPPDMTPEAWEEYREGMEDFKKLFNNKKKVACFEPTYQAVKKVYELGHKRNPKIIKDFDKVFPSHCIKIKITDKDRIKTLALFSVTYPIHIEFEPEFKNQARVKAWLDICKRLVKSARFM